jgi:hypothetical protein
MSIYTDFTIDGSGNIRSVGGIATVYNVLDLHAMLQDLADNASPSAGEVLSILQADPSELAGKRNSARPSALTLINGFNIDQTASQWLKFGSIEQGTGSSDLWTGLKTIGTIVAASPMYIVQGDAKITPFWGAGHIQILVKAKTGGALLAGNTNPTVPPGSVTVFSRKYGQTYSHFDVDLSAGSEQVAAVNTALDANVDPATITPAVAASYFASAIGGTGGTTPAIALSFTGGSYDLGNGSGAQTYSGTITLNGTITLAQAYQALMWACSDSSTITLNGIPGWKYRALVSGFAENVAAPFGSFAGGKWFVAQGWWLTGVAPADSKNYQLITTAGTPEIPPNSLQLSVTGLAVGDYVLCGRDDGAGNLLENEYTITAALGATTLSVPGLKSDTPQSGHIRVNGDKLAYTSWTGTTITLAAATTVAYSAAPAFVPFIDDAASSGSISSAAFLFNANFNARFRVRNNASTPPIIPFESNFSVTSAGGSGTAVRTADA